MTHGYGSKLSHQGTAGFSPCFHLPGFYIGVTLFLTTSCHIWRVSTQKNVSSPSFAPTPSPSFGPRLTSMRFSWRRCRRIRSSRSVRLVTGPSGCVPRRLGGGWSGGGRWVQDVKCQVGGTRGRYSLHPEDSLSALLGRKTLDRETHKCFVGSSHAQTPARCRVRQELGNHVCEST